MHLIASNRFASGRCAKTTINKLVLARLLAGTPASSTRKGYARKQPDAARSGISRMSPTAKFSPSRANSATEAVAMVALTKYYYYYYYSN
jgi:hypothetical protein